MIALILKDIATLKKTLLLTVTISIALAVYGIYENELFMVPLICAMIPLILTAIAFATFNFQAICVCLSVASSENFR